MTSSDKIWTAGLVIIGDEILSGRTHDKNIAQVASWLQVQGIRLSEVRVVADIQSKIVEAVNVLRADNDYLFTTGGIGPTHDDITVDAVAEALGVDVIVHPTAREILERYYADKGGVNEGRLRMARRSYPQSQIRCAWHSAWQHLSYGWRPTYHSRYARCADRRIGRRIAADRRECRRFHSRERSRHAIA